jgi:hypothetical protein
MTAMLLLLNDYLKIGAESSGGESGWTLAVATVLVAALILKRQSKD